MLFMKDSWSRAGREHTRLIEAGVTQNVIDMAISAFILEIVARHGEPSNRQGCQLF